jgi:cAMP and cAMP-inhibited cGMP 3',5'-cyclic phosphodiesterase 10
MTRERRLNDFLLAVTKSIFQELVSMDAVMLKIMVENQELYSKSTLFHFSRVMQKN